MPNWKQKYPQHIWSAKISSLIKSQLISNDRSAIYWDAPCGNGMIASLVSQDWPNLQFRLLDQNPALLSSPYTKQLSEKFKVEIGDIFNTRLPGKNNVWFLINSLYCLPDSRKLIESHRDHFKQIVLLVPDKEAKNFKYFTRRNPDFKNPSLLSVDETKVLFENLHFHLILQERITKVSFHFWSEVFDRLFFPPPFKNFILTLLDKLMFWRKGQYVLLVYEKDE